MQSQNSEIKLLSKQVIDLITAGEVVERPANVVKELIENALDANAKNIDIRIEQGGQKLISISDDGVGIAQHQLHLAATNHATSKIIELEDLYAKFTLGFRGEALASIRAVSDFTIASRIAQSEQGWQLQNASGNADMTDIEPMTMAMDFGTKVVVKNIFEKVPAREKFLRKTATEWRYIRNIVEKFALTHWQIGFSLYHDNKKIFQLLGSSDRSGAVTRLAQFYKIPAGAWCAITDERADMQLQGWLISPDAQQTNKADLIVTINNRIVTSPEVIRAVNDAYKGLTHGHGDPSGLLDLQIEAQNVDVNAHPSKERVRLRYANSVYRFVQQAVHKSFSNYTPSRQVSVLVNPSGETKLGENFANDISTSNPAGTRPLDAYQPDTLSQQPYVADQSKRSVGDTSATLKSPITLNQPPAQMQPSDASAQDNQAHTHQAVMFDHTKHSLGRVIGQFSGTFILVEGKEGLIIVDMHAAHERIVLERMMQKIKQNKKISNQRYIVPIQIRMAASDVSLWEENLSMLSELGIEVNVENNSLNIIAMPEMLQFEDTKEIIPQITEILRDEIHSAVSITLEKKIEAIVGNIACKQALKANTSLSHAQMQQFVDEFGSTQRVSWCNHGRPSWNMINFKQLEKICRRGE